MTPHLLIALGTLLPFLGTSLGAASVFLLKKSVPRRLNAAFLGFAAGVMLAASVWSLLLPSLELGGTLWTSLGFFGGGMFFLWSDRIVLRHAESGTLSPTATLVFSVTLHNIPEGMAVGVAVAEALLSHEAAAFTAAAILALGIAVQNFPEGAVISMPLRALGKSRFRSFLPAFLSGTVEPVAAAAAILFTALLRPLLPFCLSFAAGAMIEVVSSELLPNISEDSSHRIGTLFLFLGFLTMMVLDVLLS